MEFILKLDQSLFLFLNKTVSNPVFDKVMPFVTNADNWVVPLALGWLSLIIFGGKKGRVTALLVVIIVALSDQMSSAVIKPMIGRLRPCNPYVFIEGAHFLRGMKTSLSFPSSHAANNAAVATLITARYPRVKWIFIGLALLVGYSRIYVGVHYPLDVLGGFLVGILCAILIMRLSATFTKYWHQYRLSKSKNES